MRRTALVLLAMIPAAAAAQEPARPTERTVVVSATAQVEREPERAELMLAVESTAATARAAAQANATKMDALIAALRRLGISGPLIRTVSYQLQPQYAGPSRDTPNAPPRITGYRAANMVNVTVDTVAKVGGTIDAAIAAGANRVAGLSFELRDPDAAHEAALRLAVTKAQRQAQAMAQAAGQRLGDPITIQSGGFNQPRMYRQMDMAMEMQAAAPTPIEAGVLTIGANVTITYRLER
jgi:uncharacterized protein YggE